MRINKLLKAYQNFEPAKKFPLDDLDKLSTSEKIKKILDNLKAISKNSEKDLILDGCLQVIKKEGTSEEIAEIQKKYFEQVNQPLVLTIDLEGKKKKFTYPHYYKERLAKRSAYFQKLFFGKFKEEKETTFKINFDTYTMIDDIDSFDRLIKIALDEEELSNEDSSLILLADYLSFLPLKEKMLVTLKEDPLEIITKFPQILNILKIENFKLSPAEITDDLIEALSRCENLKIDLSNNFETYEIIDAAVEKLARLPNLIDLDLSHCPAVSDDTLNELEKNKTLENLYLTGCYQVTDSGIKKLINIPSLRQIEISGCDLITDAMIEKIRKLYYR